MAHTKNPNVPGASSLRLRCLVEGDVAVFTVTVPADNEISDLKKFIHQEKDRGIFRDINASDLVVLKVDLNLNNYTKAALRDLKVEDGVNGAEELEGWRTVSHYWKASFNDTLHVFVKLPAAGGQQTSGSKLAKGGLFPRKELVTSLYEQALDQGFVLVSGTPGSGKTTLLGLLRDHVPKDSLVHRIGSWKSREHSPSHIWPRFDSLADFKHQSYDQLIQHISFGEKPIWLLFDDAQDTYWDVELWNGLFKEVMSIGFRSKIRIVCFASYRRSPSHWNDRHGTPERISAEACMGLFPTNPITHALLFTKAEFDGFMEQCDELVTQGAGNASGWPMLDNDLKNYVFTTSNGHIGAITGLLNLAAVAAKAEPNRVRLSPKQPLQYDMFFSHWNLDILFSKLQDQPGGFGRGLPQAFNNMSASRLDLLREIVSEGQISVVDLDSVPDMSDRKEQVRAEEAREMKQFGWVYVSPDVTREGTVIVELASPLHRAWFSSRLQRNKPLPPTVSNLDKMWKDVLTHFSAAALRNPIRTLVSSRGATFVESQYQQEFYRSLYSLTGGACCVSPECGGQTSFGKGRIDFFIGNKGWGIELLRDGDRIPGHISRFRAGGAYHPWLASGHMKEYVILDFRQTLPSEPCYVDRLFHVVYTENFTGYQIYDSSLRPVGDLVELIDYPKV